MRLLLRKRLPLRVVQWWDSKGENEQELIIMTGLFIVVCSVLILTKCFGLFK
jgi:hypothetical protein